MVGDVLDWETSGSCIGVSGGRSIRASLRSGQVSRMCCEVRSSPQAQFSGNSFGNGSDGVVEREWKMTGLDGRWRSVTHDDWTIRVMS